MASTLESTLTEIWLDRCYWGYGKRAEGKWSDKQFDKEIADLNALVLGLGVELTFNDDWAEILGGSDFDALKVKLRFPNFDLQESVYAWKVYAIKNKMSGGGEDVVMSGGRDARVQAELWPEPEPKDRSRTVRNRQGTDRYTDGDYVVEESVEVNTQVYCRARIDVKYWPDRNDPAALAERVMLVDD